jgi:predicted transcriptional regulator
MTEEQTTHPDQLVTCTADIVSAFVSNNSVSAGEISGLIGDVHAALRRTAEGAAALTKEPKAPAVPIKKSVQPDYIVCLDDGKRFKTLKRHLRTVYDMSPDEYRAKWNLPATYPRVAPNYAATRSALAKKLGLGQARRAIVKSKPAAKGSRRKAAKA